MTDLNRTRYLSEAVLISVGADVTNPITQLRRSVPHGAEDQLSFSSVIAAAPKHCCGLNDDDFLLWIVREEMLPQLISEEPQRRCHHMGIVAGIAARSTSPTPVM